MFIAYRANQDFNVLSFCKLFVVEKCKYVHFLVFLTDRNRYSNFSCAIAWSTLRANFSSEAVITNSFVFPCSYVLTQYRLRAADLDSAETASGEKLALCIGCQNLGKKHQAVIPDRDIDDLANS